MGFQTPLYELADYLTWTRNGRLQLPDFQRGYKWEDERVRQLLVTVLRGHPLGVVMVLRSGNDQIRFKPRAVDGVTLPSGTEPALLLLDGQQRLTSLTQALTGAGIVHTKDTRGKLMDRRYCIHMETALDADDRIDDAVKSLPADGVIRVNFGRDIELDLSTPEKEREAGYFPANLLFGGASVVQWIIKCPDQDLAARFHAQIVMPVSTYNIPAIELDEKTSKSAVATVFEKVNTGGLPLNVFELLTATFAGDRDYYEQHQTDFRLNDHWQEIHRELVAHSVLTGVENTDVLQAVSLLATRKRHQASTKDRAPAISAKRDDLLKLGLADYLEWADPVKDALLWCSTFLADQHIFDARYLPYAKQLVPLAAIRVVLGTAADLHSVRARLSQWFWCGVLGELYGGSIETRFAYDIQQVPTWASGAGDDVPRTVADANFVASRLLTLRTRNAAAYKGLYTLIVRDGAKDWMYDKSFDKQQYVDLAVDIHHIFPEKWCDKHGVDPILRDCIVNKTPLSAETNRSIGGVPPTAYLRAIQRKAQLDPPALDAILSTHHIDVTALREDDFVTFFDARVDALIGLIEAAMGKRVQNDLAEEHDPLAAFDPEDRAVIADIGAQEE